MYDRGRVICGLSSVLVASGGQGEVLEEELQAFKYSPT